MPGDADADPDESPERRLAEIGSRLAEGIEEAMVPWCERQVARVAVAQGRVLDDELLRAARVAGEEARADIGVRLRALLAADVEEQRANPLALVRAATRYPTAVLAASGCEPVARDEFRSQQFPDDVYDLAPASFADLDPSLQATGVEWGAAKAYVHLRRHAAGPRTGVEL